MRNRLEGNCHALFRESGNVDRNLLRLVARLPLLSESAERHALLRRGDDLLIAHSQWLLKNEWENVKREADIFGSLRRGRIEQTRAAAYEDFCKQNDIDAFLDAAGRPPRSRAQCGGPDREPEARNFRDFPVPCPAPRRRGYGGSAEVGDRSKL
jgi:hypothetical protein